MDHLLNMRIQKFKETRDSRYVNQNQLGKACFKYDIAYGGFKDLSGRTASQNALRDKAFNIAIISENDEYQGGLSLTVYNFFYKTSASI